MIQFDGPHIFQLGGKQPTRSALFLLGGFKVDANLWRSVEAEFLNHRNIEISQGLLESDLESPAQVVSCGTQNRAKQKTQNGKICDFWHFCSMVLGMMNGHEFNENSNFQNFAKMIEGHSLTTYIPVIYLPGCQSRPGL